MWTISLFIVTLRLYRHPRGITPCTDSTETNRSNLTARQSDLPIRDSLLKEFFYFHYLICLQKIDERCRDHVLTFSVYLPGDLCVCVWTYLELILTLTWRLLKGIFSQKTKQNFCHYPLIPVPVESQQEVLQSTKHLWSFTANPKQLK